MTTPTLTLDAYLDANRLIAVTWCTEDILDIRPALTDDQAWEVLQAARSDHDAGVGINWAVLESHADELFPAPDEETDADGRAEP